MTPVLPTVPFHSTLLQAAYLASLIEPYSLRRCLRELRPAHAQLPVAEVQLQVDYTPQQAEAYKTLLARNFEVLADPKPPRYAFTDGVASPEGWG